MWQASGNSGGKTIWAIDRLNDVIEKFLNKGKRYKQAEELVRRYNL